MSRTHPPPPAAVWAITGTLLLIFAISTFYLYLHSQSFEAYNKNRLQAFHSSGGKRIVALGTSLMQRAVFHDEFMSDFAKEVGYEDLSFLRMVRYGGALEDFLPLLEPILDAEPRIVIIESNLFLENHRRILPAVVMDDYRMFLRFALVHPTNIEAFEKDGRGDLELHKELPGRVAFQNPKAMERTLTKIRQSRVRKVNLPKELENFFDRAHKKGIEIVIVDIPPCGLLQDIIRETQGQNHFSELVYRLNAMYDVDYLPFPDKLGLDCYEDFSHFNQKGREKYSRWMLSRISTL